MKDYQQAVNDLTDAAVANPNFTPFIRQCIVQRANLLLKFIEENIHETPKTLKERFENPEN